MSRTIRTLAKKVIRRPALAAVKEALRIPSGQISMEEAKFLGSLVRELDPSRPIIEIGTLFGWSTRVITLFKAQETELITVDAYVWNPLGLSDQHHFDITSSILEESKRTANVRQVRQDKEIFYREYDGVAPSLIFLDADHTYEATLSDLMWASKYNDTLICLHDYRKEWPGVIKVVDQFGGPERLQGTLCVLKLGSAYSA